MKNAVSTLLECLGEDPAREGLQDTPKRMAYALEFLTRGRLASPTGLPIGPQSQISRSTPLHSLSQLF